MKRFLSLILALVFSLALCGCQKDETMQPGDVDEINRIPMEKLPTAKELIQNGGWGEVETMDMDVSMVMKVKMSAGSLLEGTSDTDSGLGGDLMMNMGISMDANVQTGKDVVFIDGEIGVDVLGMSYSEPMTQYVVTQPDGTSITYEKDSVNGGWTYSTEPSMDLSAASDISGLADIDLEVFHDLELLPASEGDQIYTVRARIKISDLADKGLDLGSMAGAVGGDSPNMMEDMEFIVTLGYDVETLRLTSMMLDLDPETAMSEDAQFETFALSVYVNSVNEISVTVPQEVLDTAEEAKEYEPDIWDDSWNNSDRSTWNDPAAEV